MSEGQQGRDQEALFFVFRLRRLYFEILLDDESLERTWTYAFLSRTGCQVGQLIGGAFLNGPSSLAGDASERRLTSSLVMSRSGRDFAL
jgi:hypothetical protein